MAKRAQRLPTAPPNAYGAHPGAGWAPPRTGRRVRRTRVQRTRRMSTGWIVAACVLAYLAFFYVVLPVLSWLL
ncbi:hypothetical protein HMPREF1486_02362 [Streptomyces sp. HPH0547]|uniref:hypothetical protein n=1 Tax=Streptomyces TaxID=1883 RepID=UPI00034E5194|nr:MULTISPECIES: hypothetical protein [Streptomyces]EPD94967.1 hypothetical protein HMPREF1486_02362 [Streptomyces sp. HPH0547]MDI6408336.1 hypothetical protein [Streptomyces albus]GHJ22233.1 hypothetical protein TPA0909_38470 [Streptomyces albus]